MNITFQTREWDRIKQIKFQAGDTMTEEENEPKYADDGFHDAIKHFRANENGEMICFHDCVEWDRDFTPEERAALPEITFEDALAYMMNSAPKNEEERLPFRYVKPYFSWMDAFHSLRLRGHGYVSMHKYWSYPEMGESMFASTFDELQVVIPLMTSQEYTYYQGETISAKSIDIQIPSDGPSYLSLLIVDDNDYRVVVSNNSPYMHTVYNLDSLKDALAYIEEKYWGSD